MNPVKRFIDISLSLLGLIILSPLFLFIAILIKLDSRGPVFYPADRIGKNFERFRMWKFRTMIDIPIKVGESVSPQFDPRVTPIGRFLRRTKINELPQLINILKGEMTFVGPRPEAADLAELYPEEAKRVFSVTPGLVSPATILGRNEEELYPPGVDAKKYYIEYILPKKIMIDLEFIEKSSLLKDIKYIFLGLKETLLGAISKRHFRDNRSQIYLFLSDITLMVLSYFFAFATSYWIWDSPLSLWHASSRLLFVIPVRLTCNLYYGLYNTLIRYLSPHDILNVLKGVTWGSIILVFIDFFFSGLIKYFRLILVIDWAFLVIVLSVFRLVLRIYWDKRHRKSQQRNKTRILIYGVCDEGNAMCRALTSENYYPFQIVGFIDDFPQNYGKIINGKRVLGSRHNIEELSKIHQIDEILVSNGKTKAENLEEIENICIKAGLRVRSFNTLEDFHFQGPYINGAKQMRPAELLPIQKVQAERIKVKKILYDQSILINAPTAALGMELCRKILQYGCRRLIIIDRYESYLNELMADLINRFSQNAIVPCLLDPMQEEKLEEIFRRYHPGIVIHCGMRKYEPFLGIDLGDLGQSNYLRTFNLAKFAANYEAENFILISSLLEKQEGHPINDSLRAAEVSLEHFFSGTRTQFIITRLCDIMDNRGGVLAILDSRIRKCERVILPAAEAQVKFVSGESGAEFILKSLVEAKESFYTQKIFSCDPGPPIPLIEIVRKLAKFYGLKLNSDFEVRYSDQWPPACLTFNQKAGQEAEIPSFHSNTGGKSSEIN